MKKKKPKKLKKISEEYKRGFIKGVRIGERIGVKLSIDILEKMESSSLNFLDLDSKQMKK